MKKKSFFTKKERMAMYKVALKKIKADPKLADGGMCPLLHGQVMDTKVLMKLFYHDGPVNFPELWKQKTTTVREESCICDPWFNNVEERIQALKNILNEK